MEEEIKKLAKRESAASILGWAVVSVLLVGVLYSYQNKA
jgi:hypothetical protein